MKWRKYIPHAILLGIAIAVSFYALRYWGDSKLHRNYPMTELTKKCRPIVLGAYSSIYQKERSGSLPPAGRILTVI